MYIIILYIILPLLSSFFAYKDNKKLTYTFSAFSLIILSAISIFHFFSNSVYQFDLNSFLHTLITILDLVLLGYFAFIGFKAQNKKVLLLALFQAVLFLYCIFNVSHESFGDFYLNNLSFFMLIVINLVGSIIAIYAVKYMEYENCSKEKRRFFLAYLWFFIFIMNMIVISNNYLLFFFFFEMTTLSSFLLIRFRKDEISITNSLRALWLNQLGGVFILFAVIIAILNDSSIYFTQLKSPEVLIAIFLAFASFVKGASKPFESWLLGAMVAPTPVSAILHSATMVKIAPFLILKISYVFTPTLSLLITLFSMGVFAVISLQSLAKDNFKEILAYSTIALLALMVSIASMGTQEAFKITLYLIFFHAVSKAMLFMIAGVLEKQYHIKSIEDFTLLFQKSPIITSLILLGFASITMPPFGLFFAKLSSLTYISEMIKQNPLYLLVAILFVVGSSLLVLLYFKVASKLIDFSSTQEKTEKQEVSKEFIFSSFLLFFIAVFSLVFVAFDSLSVFMFTTTIILLIAVFFLLLKLLNFKRIDRVKEYSCGEKYTHNVGVFYYDFDRYKATFQNSFIVLLFIILILGLV
jgi:ech hydrogenase subunit A